MRCLVKGFKNQAGDENGLIKSEITFQEVQNQFGHQWSMTIADYKETFLIEAEKICDEMGIVIGYNETENGFEVGFQHPQDHTEFMGKIEETIAVKANSFVKPSTVQLLADTLIDSGIWELKDREENIRKMTTPAGILTQDIK